VKETAKRALEPWVTEQSNLEPCKGGTGG
jgi:hypothetical protein